MPAGDNPHSISEKKAALRGSPKEPKNVVNQQPRNSPFPEDKAAEIVGIKRPQPNGPLSPTNHHMLGNPGANGHLVYVRRRLETDQSKGGASASSESQLLAPLLCHQEVCRLTVILSSNLQERLSFSQVLL